MLKAIHASEDIVAAREKAIRVIEKLRGLRLTRAAELVEAAVEETLTYYAFPEEHWRRIRTNNPLDEEIFEHRAAEGPADERCHHRLSQCRAPLSQTESAKNSGHYPGAPGAKNI